MRVVIADDSALIREGLARLLAEAGYDVVAKVGDADALEAAVTDLGPGLVIADVRMPPEMDDDGARAAQRLRAAFPCLPIVLLSQHVETRWSTELASAGAFGYLLKDRVLDVDDFLDALRRVTSGGSAIDPEVIGALLRPSHPDDPSRATSDASCPSSDSWTPRMTTGASSLSSPTCVPARTRSEVPARTTPRGRRTRLEGSSFVPPTSEVPMKSTTQITVDVSSPQRQAPTGRASLQRTAGIIAVASAVLFFVNSLIEFRYGLFDGATGPAAIANQVGFSLALLGWATALVLLLRARLAARGRFAVVAFSLQVAGLSALVAGNVTSLAGGSQDSPLFPLGGMAQLLGGLLGGIALALPGRLAGWHRVAALVFAVVPVAVAFVLMGSQNLAVESLLPAAWIALGIALAQDAREA